MVYPALRQAVPGFLFHIGICATMGVDPRQPGLFVGPHYEEVPSGMDLSGFRARLTDEGSIALFASWGRLLTEPGLHFMSAFDPTAVHRALFKHYLEGTAP